MYSSEEASEKVWFLTSGEFKVTKRLAHNTPLAMLGHGSCFGVLDADAPPLPASTSAHFAVFASCEATVIEVPSKELLHLLPDDVLRKLQAKLDSDMLLAGRSTSREVSSLVARSHSDAAPLRPHRRSSSSSSLLQHTGALPHLSQEEERAQEAAGSVPPRVPKDTGPMSQAAFQTGFTSGGMATFFASVANG